jgi:hypothetical protein
VKSTSSIPFRESAGADSLNLLVMLDGHAGDRVATVAVLEQADRETVGPLAELVRRRRP